MSVRILTGDCRTLLREMDAESVHCIVTSPPYFGLRDYGVAGQIGLEPSPEEFVAELVSVFRAARRVLRDDGTLWLNMGDSYANDGKWGGHTGGKHAAALHCSPIGRNKRYTGLKPKDLIGIPWRLALALQADGWFLRSDIIWHKKNPMPEPVTDRPTSAHEHIFLLSKSERYYYDAEAVKEPAVSDHPSGNGYDRAERLSLGGRGQREPWDDVGGARNLRNVWTVESTGNRERECLAILGSDLSVENKWDAIKAMMGGAQTDVWRVATKPFPEAHFATFPPDLIEPCIKAGCPAGGVVLDPFGGAGTTGLVADRLGRNAVLIELNPEYAEMARRRIVADAGMFAEVA